MVGQLVDVSADSKVDYLAVEMADLSEQRMVAQWVASLVARLEKTMAVMMVGWKVVH